jgi:putative Holliday junction resolvase
MRYLGLDLGTITLGLSISDVTGTIATTLKTIRFEDSDYDALIPELRSIINQYKVDMLVLGLPKNMNNSLGERATKSTEFADMVRKRTGIEVVMWDERLSTVSAHNAMLEADVSRKKRYDVVDKVAAVIILQNYLDYISNK